MNDYQCGTVVQIAYTVDDVRESARNFSIRTGAGPFFVRRNAIAGTLVAGGTTGRFDHSSAYGQWGRVQVELVQTHLAEPPEFAETTTARQCVHHVAMMVRSVAEQQRKFAEIGWPLLYSATTPNGNDFAFHDARKDLGHLVEIYEARPSILRLYERVADAAVDWDGSDPVRDM